MDMRVWNINLTQVTNIYIDVDADTLRHLQIGGEICMLYNDGHFARIRTANVGSSRLTPEHFVFSVMAPLPLDDTKA